VIRQPKGFSLLEVLIAFAIMAVAITIVLRIFASGVNNAVISEEYSLGVQIAESKLAGVGIESPLDIGETVGNVANKYDWAINISEVDQNSANYNNAQTLNVSPKLFMVIVRVTWEDGSHSFRSIELNTLKLL